MIVLLQFMRSSDLFINIYKYGIFTIYIISFCPKTMNIFCLEKCHNSLKLVKNVRPYRDRNQFDRNQILRETSEPGGPFWFRNVSRYFSTIEFPIHVNLIAVVRSLRRWQYAGIKKSVRGTLSRGSVYPWWSGAKYTSRISRFAPSHPVAPISYAKQPSGQVLFECLRNRRFCPSSDEHHCLSICLSVYRIDIREWQDRRPCSLILLPPCLCLALSLSSPSAASPSSKMYFCAFMREARPSLVPSFVLCPLRRFSFPR